MASEETGERSISVDLPPEVHDWLTERDDADPPTTVRRLLAAHRTLDEDHDGDGGDGEGLGVDPGLEDRLEEQRAEFQSLLEDVRERVVQVKREADAKAPADHDHEDLDTRVSEVLEEVAAVREDVASLSAAVDDAEDRIDAGFENYEDILRYLTESVEELEDRVDVLARAIIDARQELNRLAAHEATRTEVQQLKRAANRQGIDRAACAHCDGTVRVALLTDSECPHCASPFAEVESKRGLFGSNRLIVGDPPALTGTTGGDLDESLDDLIEAGADADSGAARAAAELDETGTRDADGSGVEE